MKEINKDVKRLETITERFSKVGSKPKLENENIYEILNQTVSYLQDRLSSNVNLELDNQCNDSTAPINSTLFEWVVENICKNAAMRWMERDKLKSYIYRFGLSQNRY